MTQGTVVLVGSLPVEHLTLDLLVAEFGWTLKQTSGLDGLVELNAGHNVVTALFSPRNLALPWDQALRAVLNAAPKALPVLCHGFADAIDWPQAAEAGGFHSLLLPFNVREVRQSLGFVLESKRRSAVIPTPPLVPSQQHRGAAVRDQLQRHISRKCGIRRESTLQLGAKRR
jgi:hypothetical protein